jgi:hypothetical protein
MKNIMMVGFQWSVWLMVWSSLKHRRWLIGRSVLGTLVMVNACFDAAIMV